MGKIDKNQYEYFSKNFDYDLNENLLNKNILLPSDYF